MYKYELTLRCASFNLWPENKEFGIKLHSAPSNVAALGESAVVSYAVRSYGNDRSFNVEKKTISENRGGPPLWIEQQTGGRRHGPNWLVALGEPMEGGIALRCPVDGEIDVVVRCESDQLVDETYLSVVLSSSLYKLAAFLRFTLDPHLAVSLRPQLVVYGNDGQRHVRENINWSVVARRPIDGHSVASAIDDFVRTVSDLDTDHLSRLGAASRRSFTL